MPHLRMVFLGMSSGGGARRANSMPEARSLRCARPAIWRGPATPGSIPQVGVRGSSPVKPPTRQSRTTGESTQKAAQDIQQVGRQGWAHLGPLVSAFHDVVAGRVGIRRPGLAAMRKPQPRSWTIRSSSPYPEPHQHGGTRRGSRAARSAEELRSERRPACPSGSGNPE